ncbi:MAG: DUF4446 family protein [Patescibacteria group bacterium]|nr:DUF4446 family protein [Patescibacteria group bacterium]
MIDLVSIFFFLWIFSLSYLVLKIRAHYQKLVAKTKKERLDEILDFLLEKEEQILKEINSLKESFHSHLNLSRKFLQKFDLLRYDPFQREGVKQSFVIVFLDAENNGLILNFIYTKDGLRIYPKKITKGKSEEYELSDEEKKLIKRVVSN